MDREPFPGIDEALELTCRCVAQSGAWAAGQDGRHPASFAGEAAVADGEDAAVECVQVASLSEAINRGGGDPELQKLAAGHHAVLAEGQLGDSWRQ